MEQQLEECINSPQGSLVIETSSELLEEQQVDWEHQVADCSWMYSFDYIARYP